MATVTDSDIKEIKEAASPWRDPFGIASLGKQINEVEKNLLAKISDMAGDLKAVKAQIDQIDKRITNQEFIYRAVYISIITLATGAIGTSVIRFFWDNPLFHS